MDVIRRTSLIELLRSLRWHVKASRRRNARNAKYPDVNTKILPIVFGNAMAKSGSHLLSQFLEGIASASPLVFTAEHPVRTITREGRHRPDKRVLKDLRRLAPGDIGWGYIPSRPQYKQILTDADWITYFIYRDPRDKIISHIFFAMDIHPDHAMRDYYHSLPSMETRIEVTVKGVPGLVASIIEAYDRHRDWLSSPSVIKIRFEDLINNRDASLEKLLSPVYDRVLAEHVNNKEKLIEHLKRRMSPQHSRTFREGKTGSWRDHFTKKNVDQFKEIAGELLIDLGYEQDDNWI